MLTLSSHYKVQEKEDDSIKGSFFRKTNVEIIGKFELGRALWENGCIELNRSWYDSQFTNSDVQIITLIIIFQLP